MKKSNLTIGILYLLFGIGCMILTLLMGDKLNGLDGLLFGFGGAGIGSGSVIIYKYFYWTSEKHKKEYYDKLENEQIELHDELNEMLRAKAGQHTYVLGMVVIAVSMPVFVVFDALQIFMMNNLRFVGFLSIYLIFQILAGNIIYKHLLKKYQ